MESGRLSTGRAGIHRSSGPLAEGSRAPHDRRVRCTPLLNPDPDRLPRIITRAEAIARGMSRHAVDHRVSTGRWRRVLPRTYLTVDTFTEYDRMQAALAFAGAGALLSGAAALRASEVRRIRMPSVVLVLVPPPNPPGSAAGVLVRPRCRSL